MGSSRARGCRGLRLSTHGFRLIARGTYWAVYAGEDRDRAYLLLDVSRLAGTLTAADRRSLGPPYELLRFAGPEDRDAYARERDWL